MTYEQLEGFFTPIYVFLAFGLIILIIICLLCYARYLEIKSQDDNKAKIKSLEDRLKTKTELDRLRYEHELMFSEYKEKNNGK